MKNIDKQVKINMIKRKNTINISIEAYSKFFYYLKLYFIIN